MANSMPLSVELAHATATGPRETNEDFVAAATPDGALLLNKGIVAAIADGVSGLNHGREAAEYSVRGLLADYYATPDSWHTQHALTKVLQSLNRWVISQAQQRREVAGMATTLTALVLQGARYTLAHVGDSRAYLLRDGVLRQLSFDHVWDRPDMRHVLKRAIGLDTTLNIDFAEGELRVDDVFVLITDGVWGALSDATIQDTLRYHPEASTAAQALVDDAIAANGADNASALVMRILGVGEDGLQQLVSARSVLMPPPRLKVGQTVDDFRVDALLHESAATIVYRATDLINQREVVLKTLTPERGETVAERSALAHEEWLARRAVARFFPQVLAVPGDRQSALYYLQTWHAGRTLKTAIDAGQHLTVPEVLAWAIKLARALGALHRRGILHRDVKPDNIHIGSDGELRLLDFGVALSVDDADEIRDRAGTPSYLAPEYFAVGGVAPAIRGDLYAAGVSLYYALTRKYPYGEIEPFQTPVFGEPVPPTRYRPDIPVWFESVIMKAIQRKSDLRFETAEELVLALEAGAARPLTALGFTPLLQRGPLAKWQAVALVSIVFNLLLLFLLLMR